MNNLHFLYRNLLSQFEFSIFGYNDVEKKVEDFFHSMSKMSGVFDMENLDFISFAYARLHSIEPWEIKALHTDKFFFNSFHERSTELYITHDYYTFKDVLKNINSELYDVNKVDIHSDIEKQIKKVSTSDLISELFSQPTPFRVILSDVQHIVVKYNQHLDILNFELPVISFFKNGINSVEEARNAIFTLYEKQIMAEDKSIDFKYVKNGFEYKKNEEEIFLKCFSEELIDKMKLKELLILLTRKIQELSMILEIDIFRHQPKKDYNENNFFFMIENFAKLILSHAHLSLLFNSWVESIPSVIAVEEHNQEKRSLGALIIGYQKESQISSSQRAIYRIISDKLSSNLASDAVSKLVPNLRLKKLRNQQMTILKKFHNEVLKNGAPNLDHGLREITEDDVKKKNEFFTEFNSKILSDCGLKDFREYVDREFKEGERTFKGCYVILDKVSNLRNSIYKTKVRGDNYPFNVQLNNVKDPYLNIILARKIIDFLCEEEHISNHSVASYNEKDKCGVYITLDFREDIFLNKLKDSFLANRNDGPGSIPQFFSEYYKDILICGNLIISDIDYSPLINFKEDIKAEYDENFKVLSFKLYKEFDEKPHNQLIYNLIFNSL